MQGRREKHKLQYGQAGDAAQVSRQSGKKIYVTEKKMGCLQCIDLPGACSGHSS